MMTRAKNLLDFLKKISNRELRFEWGNLYFRTFMRSTQLYHLENLSIAEKIQLVEDLWDEIAESSENMKLTSSQEEELKKRIEQRKNNPVKGSSFEEIKNKIRELKK